MAYARKTRAGGLEVLYCLSQGIGHPYLILRVPPDQNRIPSLANRFPFMGWYEREMHDLFGLEFEGHPEPYPLVLHEGTEPSHPLLQGPSEQPLRFSVTPPTVPAMIGPEIQRLPFGPVRADITESAQFLFFYIGEGILHYHPRLFYKHRGMEQRFEGASLMTGVILSERVSGTDSIAHALAYCQACEAALGWAPPSRAHLIRVILAELERLTNHLHFFAELAKMTTLKVADAQGHWLEERAKQINGILTGNRFLRGILCVGGLRHDLDLSGLHDALEPLERDTRSYLGRLEETRSFLDRLIGTGRLTRAVAFDQGATGPIERASGLDRDLRRDLCYAGYATLHFEVPQQSTGDAWARACIRRDEIRQSLSMIRQCLEKIKPGPVWTDQMHAGPGPLAEGLGWAEGTRGALYYAVHYDPAQDAFDRVKIKDPSFSNWRVSPFTVQDSNLMDYAINEASFGLSIAGADR
ncbi:NADH-ubiquinone oxidoreductase, chain 49kDa [mine drainage metagenome]|uniref:NADH-ubiquinone oxidoreductase, chain 49kDa n=2 Tax=mine drainage metagenome TaxID=410659 RepID=T1CPP5_9ZZZZ